MMSVPHPSEKLSVWGIVARFMARVGVLPLFLSVADRWVLKSGRRGRPVFPFLIPRRESEYQILIYHRVNDDQDPFFPAVPIRTFEVHMGVLSRHFNVLPLGELVERSRRKDIPPRAVAITFDDGYRDNYEHAFPIFRQAGFPVTIFLATGSLGDGEPLWHDRVFHGFRRARATSLLLAGTEYGLATVAERRVALNRAALELKTCHPDKRNDMIQQLIAKLDPEMHYPETLKKLDWRHIREMSRHKVTFGAHTVTHPILTRMPLAEAVDEIKRSKDTIERQIENSVDLFAYPNGGRDDFNEPLKAAVKQLGFVCAVTTLWGANGPDRDPFELRRVGVWDSDPLISPFRLGWYKFSGAEKL